MSSSRCSRSHGFHWLRATLAIGLFGLAGAAQASPLVYTIVNNPSYQNGWTITGSVTTDGTVDSYIGFANITAWEVTLTKPGNPTHSLASTDYNASTGGANIYATATQLLMGFSENSTLSFFSAGAQMTLEWFRAAPLSIPPVYDLPQSDKFFAINYPNNELWANNVENGVLPLLSDASGNWIVATTSQPAPVPEIDPAGMGSVLALVTGVLGLRERRRHLGA